MTASGPPAGRYGIPGSPKDRWRSALPDLGGCLLALALAWALSWRTADLIWSMWLASLVIGYALILWQLIRTPLMTAIRHGAEMRQIFASSPVKAGLGLLVLLFVKVFLLAFFTVHFGGFHWVHSMFVNFFFPISPRGDEDSTVLSLADYALVVAQYAWFLPLALMAQRHRFSLPETRELVAGIRQFFERDLFSKHEHDGPKLQYEPDFAGAYKGVIRLHLLIFFLFGAFAVGLPDFIGYVVVYLVYFFPFKKLFRAKSG